MSTCELLRKLGLGSLVAMLSLAGGLATAVEPGAASASPAAEEAEGRDSASAPPLEVADRLVVNDRTAPPDAQGRYLVVVRFQEPALASYSGGVQGLEATSPRVRGEDRLDVRAPHSQAYLAYLEQQQSQHLDGIESALGRGLQVQHRFLNALNAVTFRATLEEARDLQTLAFVRSVHLDDLREPTTDVGPGWIGAPAIWTGATTSGAPNKGEGIVIGIIDSGFVHAHPSFAAIAPGDGYPHVNPLGPGNYLGLCAATPGLCNDKLIGSYNFHPDTAVSEDTSGHGTHVASTAGGNPVDASFLGLTIPISGVAPRANLINYRVCFPTCPGTSSIAAVNQAITDGIVDVLNYSISGSDNPWNDPVDLAFLDAFNAGIYISASAGNSGPGASTVAKTGPWNAAVANSSHNRIFAHTVDAAGILGMAGIPGSGPTVAADISADLITASSLGNVEGCSAFPAGSMSGRIALIRRGTCSFAIKVNNAVAAGAIGVIAYNNAGGPPIVMGGLESTPVPAVMIDNASGLGVEAAATPASTATIYAGISAFTSAAWGDVIANTSSRGPSQFDLIKPDFAAPGTNILAAYYSASASPVFGAISGTSMASPHGAGAAALMVKENPSWSPAAIKSALALTANPTMLKQDAVTPSDPFDRGSGRIDLNGAARIGLVMDETHANFVAADPGIGGDPRTLNLPSLMDRSCLTTCSFTRTVTSVLGSSEDYTISVAAPAGVTITATPASFTLAAGASQAIVFDVSFDFNTAPENAWVFGSVTLTPTNPLPVMRMPVALVGVPPLPVIGVSPASVTQVQHPESTSQRSFRIGNTGGSDLDWAFLDSPPPAGLLRAAQSTALLSAAAPAPAVPGFALGRPAAGSLSSAPASVATPQGAGTTTLTHSASQTVSAGASDACAGSGQTTQNQYLRAFTLSDFGIVSDFEAGSVRFGLESLDIATTVTVNLYQLSAGDAFEYANLVSLGTASVALSPQAQTLVDVPIAGTVPAGSTLVVEVVSPNLIGSGAFFIGSNAGGQSAPSYIAASACGINEPTDLADLSLPNMHIVMNVSGSFTQSCSHPDDVAWLSASATSGTIPDPGFQDVILGLDSSGLAAGSYSANLCIGSNDTANPAVVVPVTLDVNAVPRIALSESTLSASAVVGSTASAGFEVQNVGDADLNWSIETTVVPQQKVIGTSGLLYDNGPFVTGPGTGAAAGFDASLLQSTSLGMNTLGAASMFVAPGPYFRLADDFTVTDPSGWRLESMRFFAYQTGSTTTSTFTGVNLRIWDGPPGDAGSSIVFGDETTNRIVGTGFTGAMRYSEGSIGTTRPIMFIDATVATVLLPGTYWVDWQLAGSLGSGPWQPPVTRLGERGTGNVLQLVSTGWQAWLDTGVSTQTPQDAPFQVNGQSAGDCAAPQAFPWLSVSPSSGSASVAASSAVTVDMDAAGLAPGTYQARVCVQNDDPTTSVIPFVDVSFEVLPPAITLDPATLPDGQVGQGYTASVSASGTGATAPFSFAWSGDIPAGLSLDAGGNISGTPTAAGSFSVTVTATDSTGAGSGGPFQGTQAYTIDIAPPTISVTPDLLPLAVAGQAYSAQMQASGTGAVEPFSFAVTLGSLPAGLSLNPDGSLSGAPTETGNFTFTVTASDATDAGSGGPFTGSVVVTLSVVADAEFIFFDGFENLAPGLKIVLEGSGTHTAALALGEVLAHLDPASGIVTVGEILGDDTRAGLLQARCHGNGCELRVVFLSDPEDVWAGDWMPVVGDTLVLQFEREGGRLADARPPR